MVLPFKKKESQLDIERAEQILKNVFQENRAAPNSIDLKKIISYSNYRKERFLLQKAALTAVLFLFLLLPLLFLTPSFTIHSGTESYSAQTAYTMEVKALLPIKRITATLDGHNVPVLETDFHQYSILPSANGRLAVTVTLVNGQYKTRYTKVASIDTTAPVLSSKQLKGDRVYLHLSDDGSGINYQGITAVTAKEEETKIDILFYNSHTGLLIFAQPKEPLSVLIPDYAGNILQLSFTVK